MYQSLYRKYRSSNFDEIIGQEVIVKTLKNAIINNKIAHAYLFTGPRGTGKTSIAKIFAKTINCFNLNGTNPCNECDSCNEINQKQSIDVIEIDAASNNGVDEIRDLRDKASLVPAIGKYKVYIIDEVHMLTTGAFNALLKTLEEPPAHVIFILATTEPHKIPATILSRCQRFDFKKINVQKIVLHLKNVAKQEGVDVTNDALNEIARLSDGCMRDALSIFDQVIAYSIDNITLENIHEINGTLPQSELKSFVNGIINKDYELVFSKIGNYDNLGKNFIKLSEELMLFFRNILLMINVPNLLSNSDNELYASFIDCVDVKLLLKYIDTVNKIIPDMKKSNNARIVFEITMIDLLNCDFNEEKTHLQLNNVSNSIKSNNLDTKVIKPIQNEKIIKTDNVENIDVQQVQPLLTKTGISNDTKKYTDELLEKIDSLKNIRINNTLCNFNKKDLIDLKHKIDEIRNFVINPDYSEYASLIIDAEVKAVGNNNIIFVCNDRRTEIEFNRNLIKIDECLLKCFDTSFKAIATNVNDWNIIKNEFNSKQKQYEMIAEPENIEEYFGKEEKPLIENLFDDIVEYQ